MAEVAIREKSSLWNPLSTLPRAQSGAPDWLVALQKSAADRFAVSGWPSIRDEEWKYTNLSWVAKTHWRSAEPTTRGDAAASFRGHPLLDLQVPRLVFVNGSFSPALSSHAWPEGLEVKHLRQALETRSELLQSCLGRIASFEKQALTALNTACFSDGAFVVAHAGFRFEEPLHVLNLSNVPSVAVHPRTLLVAEPDSQLSLIESHLGIDGSEYFSNPVTEVKVGSNAVVEHSRFQFEGSSAAQVGTLQIEMDRDANYTSYSIQMGSRLARLDLGAVLGGEGAHCSLNGLYLLRGAQHCDNHTQLDHTKAHCDSRELYKGVVDEQSQGVFHGRIVVYQDAQKTDSKQTNSNLVLSDSALVNSTPQLEIYADDVKCTHGATIGRLDEESLFYCRTRGIGEADARGLLIQAFAREVVEDMRNQAAKELAEKAISDWLPTR